MRTGRGGPRRGAGRRRRPGAPSVHHVRRDCFPCDNPGHVTLRVRKEIPSLRNRRFIKDFRKTLRMACERGNFRVVHYSLLGNHAHLLVEADDKGALARGMKSVGARLARAVNRVFGRSGPVLDGRYHAVVLRSPLQVRRALRYVLLNARKHWFQRRGRRPLEVELDRASSARWFKGFKEELPADRTGPSEVSRPRTWLLSTGWRQTHGLIDPAYVPGAR